jgi:hypothetical protein
VDVGERALDSYFSQFERAVELLSRDLVNGAGKHNAQRAQPLLRRFVEFHSELPYIALVRLDGQVMVTATSVPGAVLPSVAKEPSFIQGREELLTGQRISIARPLIWPVSKEWVIPFRYGIRDKKGDLLFILTAGMPLSKLQSFWQRAPLPEGAAAGLMRDDGYLVSRYPVPSDEELKIIFGKPMTGDFNKQLQREHHPVSGIVEGTSTLAGPDQLFVFRHLSSYPFTFYVVTPRSNIWLQWWGNIRFSYLLMLALMVGAFATFRRTLNRQISWDSERGRTELQTKDALAEKNTI